MCKFKHIMDAFKELSNGTLLFTLREGPFALATSGNMYWEDSGTVVDKLLSYAKTTLTLTHKHSIGSPILSLKSLKQFWLICSSLCLRVKENSTKDSRCRQLRVDGVW